MASWLVKALVQRAIGLLPNPHFWNDLLQSRVTRSLDLSRERFELGLCNCRNHLEQLERFGPSARRHGFSAFEVGTGWFPIVPLGLFLGGAREVWTWDIVPFLTHDRLERTVRQFLKLEQGQGWESHLHILPERLARLKEIAALIDQAKPMGAAELLERLDIHYCIGNASRSGLPPQSVDLIVSDVVFEYLTPPELSEMLWECWRIAAPEAVMSHTIGLGDQYAAHDSKITPFNFLRFSDRTWRWLNNPIIPLNRLRISDYRSALSQSGFQVVDEISERGNPADLARTPLAPRFRGYSVEDLLVVHTWLIAIPRLG